MSASLIGRHCQAPHLVRVVVSAAWVTLLYSVGLSIEQAATSIGRIGLESLGLEQVGRVRCGSIGDLNLIGVWRPLCPQKQT